MIHNIDNTRLEIEVPTDGLPNLIQNPTGAQGAWGYVTPVNNTNLTADTSGLTFKTNVSQASYWASEHLPVAAGQYVAARFDTVAGTASHNVKVRYEWYDANKTLLSSSVQSIAFSNTAQTNYAATIVAPTNTAFVKLRFDLYNGVANPSANATYKMTNVMVTYAATAAAVASTRRNVVPNPSFETNATGWTSFQATLARSTAQHYSGTASLSMTAGFAGNNQAAMDTGAVVTGGSDYTASAYLRAATTGRSISIGIQWFTSAGQYIGGDGDEIVVTDNTTGWTRVYCTATAPSNAGQARVVITHTNFNAVGEVHYVDGVMLEKGTVLRGYFDGSTIVAGKNYAWTGTANNSASTETATAAFEYSNHNDWRNIMGPTAEIGITRDALDVGTMSATIYDSLLDPANTDDVRPGKKIRLMADYDATGVFRNVWEGKTTAATVNYLGGTQIVVTATDNIGTLSNYAESRGVAALSDLPFILEGKGVPWNVKGSGNQVSTAAVVASNDNASVVDQVAITRDSNLGYAWVDRFNTLQVINQSDSRGEATIAFTDVAGDLDDTTISYTDLDIGYDTDEAINQVNVTWLQYDASTGETTEIPYGPYNNASSIATYGAHAATFTIQGAIQSPSLIAAYAANILTANAVPVRKANSLTFNVRDSATFYAATIMDLYNNVTVTYEDKLTSAAYVVTSIEHSITPQGWTVTLEFGSNTAVASPQMTPSPVNQLTFDPHPKMLAGQINITPSAANTPTPGTVTFPAGFFSTAPMVVATPGSSVPGTTVTGVGAFGASASGVTIYLTRTNTTATVVTWVAVERNT